MIKQRGNSWQVDLFRNGKRHRKNFATEAEAQAHLTHITSLMKDGKSLSEAAGATSSATTLLGFYEDNFDYLWGRTSNPQKYRNATASTFQYIDGDVSLSTIDDALIMKMISDMYKDKLTGSTINRKLSMLSKLLKHAKRLRLIDRVPIMDRQPEGDPRLWYLSDKQEQDLFNYLDYSKDNELFHICGFLIHTGARWGDLAKLRFKDWDRKEGTVTFGKLKQGGWHTIPLVGRAATALKWAESEWQRENAATQCDPDAVVFKVVYKTMNTRFTEVLQALGIHQPGMCFHVLRHTCASRLVQRGVDLYVVQKWLAHKNIQTTQRYAKLHPRNLQSAASILVSSPDTTSRWD